MEWLSVADAAEALGLSAPHVRRLVRDGLLPGHRYPGGWVVSASAVRARAHSARPPGRPLSPAVAWLMLSLADMLLSADGPDIARKRLAELDDRRLRFRARRHLVEAPSVERWPQWLSRRARTQRVWVHPSLAERLAADPRVRLSGSYAAAFAGLGVAAGPPGRLYVDEGDLLAVEKKYRLHADSEAQHELMVIPADVPPELRPTRGAPVPPAVACVDLLESPDARERDLAARLLGQVAGKARDALDVA